MSSRPIAGYASVVGSAHRRFDSPWVFAAILDEAAGAAHAGSAVTCIRGNASGEMVFQSRPRCDLVAAVLTTVNGVVIADGAVPGAAA